LLDKYQRLLQEFTVLKAQHSVLRKAVLAEQEKSAEQENTIKTKDQLLRKVTFTRKRSF